MTEKPEYHIDYPERSEEVKAILKFLLLECDPKLTPEAKTREVRQKLEELVRIFKDDTSIEGNVAIGGNIAIPVQSSVYKALGIDPQIISIMENDKIIYEDLEKVSAALKKADQVSQNVDISGDVDVFTESLHNPDVFNSPAFKEVLAKYPKEKRDKLKSIGIEAFVANSQVSRSMVLEALGGNA
jgi:ribosome-associated translation inhibitor RaiA